MGGSHISEHHRHKFEITCLIPTLLTANEIWHVSFTHLIMRHDSVSSALSLRKFRNLTKMLELMQKRRLLLICGRKCR